MMNMQGLSTESHLAMLIGHRYQLFEKLGQGGVGTIYRALDHLTGQTLALKRVSLPETLSETSIDDLRFSLSREFGTLASLRHPNVISVMDYGFDASLQPYFTMDLLVNAQPITDAAQALDTVGKVQLLIEMLRGLAYVHRRGIIHRDLKPANVLVDVAGRVKVLDFGLALDESVNYIKESHDSTAGTIAYMAPERFVEGHSTVASDLYSVGVMAYEIFMGHHPFLTRDITELINSVLYTTPDTASLDPHLAVVVGKLLLKQLHERYQSADEVILALCHAADLPIPQESAEIRDSFLQASVFVGRDAELSHLLDALKLADSDQKGASWLIGGESGVGKSRLLDELRIRAMVGGVLVLRGQGVEWGGLPYQLWRDPMRRLVLSTPLSEAEASILKEIVPDIGRLLNREVPDAPELDGRSAQLRLTSTIADILKRQTQPLLLLLEDLQWAVESLEPLKLLNRLANEQPWLIVASFRDEEAPELPGKLPGMQLLTLSRLKEAAIAELSAAMLGTIGRQPHVIRLLQRETEGNALFMIEVVRALVRESGSLENIGHTTLPTKIFAGGVQQVIQRRLARVPEWARKPLMLAAVGGQPVNLRLLQVADESIDWEAWLTICVNAAVLHIIDGVWWFTHEKLRLALLAEVTPEQHPGLHQMIALAIETVYPHNEAYIDALSEHWFSAGNTHKMLMYTLKAIQRLIMLSADFPRAVQLIERCLSAANTPDTVAYRALLLKALGDIAERQGNYDAASTHYNACLNLPELDGVIQVQVLNGLSRIMWRQAAYDLAQHYANLGLEQAVLLEDRHGVATSLTTLSNIAFYQGNWADARKHLEQSLVMWRRLNDQRGIANNLNTLGNVTYVQHDFETARMHHEESLALRRILGDRYGIAVSLGNLGIVTRHQGDFGASITYFQQSLDAIRDIGDRWIIAKVYSNLAQAQLISGNLPDARRNLREALLTAQAIGATSLTVEALIYGAQLSLMQGQPERSAAWVELLEHHPANTVDIRVMQLEPLLIQLEQLLGTEAFAAAQAQGKTLELATIVNELLQELTNT